MEAFVGKLSAVDGIEALVIGEWQMDKTSTMAAWTGLIRAADNSSLPPGDAYKLTFEDGRAGRIRIVSSYHPSGSAPASRFRGSGPPPQ
jgi:hypothetical protein